jgi:hypothetical protein
MTRRSGRRRLSTQGHPEPIGIQPPKPWPAPGKPQYYRLVVEIPVGERITIGRMSNAVTLVERGPLGLCEERGMAAANYGVFHLREDGTREWYRPTRIVIEPIKENSERSKGDGSHSEADS